jgi:hypothetical protein
MIAAAMVGIALELIATVAAYAGFHLRSLYRGGGLGGRGGQVGNRQPARFDIVQQAGDTDIRQPRAGGASQVRCDIKLVGCTLLH